MRQFGGNGKRMNCSNIFTLLMVLLLPVLHGCGTTKNFTVDSAPKGALVVLKPKVGNPSINGHILMRETVVGETPVTTPITFLEDTSECELLIEKRGFEQASRVVGKDSAESIQFNLKRKQKVAESLFRKNALDTSTFIVLPAYAEVHVHSGVGRLDKIEESAELSGKLTGEMNSALIAGARGNAAFKALSDVWTVEEKGEWQDLVIRTNRYLRTLDPKRLSYYSDPPYISNTVPGIAQFLQKIKAKQGKETRYVLYVTAKCVTETSGRKAGNIALALLGAASQGASRAAYGFTPYYDYSAFQPDSGTLAVLYVIDADTSEVLHIEHRTYDDVTDIDVLQKMADSLARFPHLDPNQ